MTVVFKCRKCRADLLTYPECSLISAHGGELTLRSYDNLPKVEFVDNSSNEKTRLCSSLNQEVFYMQENNTPEWIINCINKGEWTRGKLTCPGCVARVGSFDFVSGFHCACQFSVVPPIHLVKSKVDYSLRSESILQDHNNVKFL